MGDLGTIMDEIREMSQKDDMQDDEFTSMEYAARFGLTKSTARRELGRMINAGVVAERMAYRGGARVKAYRKVECPEKLPLDHHPKT